MHDDLIKELIILLSMEKDYYKILDIPRGVSESEIKKAFKKLSIKWHPDKWANASEVEKNTAEEKFKEINEAYQILSDPQKKSNYDNFGNPDGPQGFGGGFDPFGGFNPFDIFRNHGFGGNHQRGPEPGATINYKLGLNIEEIFKGCTKNVRYNRVKRCSTCGGEGGTGVKTCPHCHGTGMLTKVQRTQFGMIQNSGPCPHCNATGKTVEHVCKDCNGKGLIEVPETVEVKVNPGMRQGQTITISGKGYDSKDKRGTTGDLVITIVYDIDKNKYAIQGNDVYELISVPYYKAILGGKLIRKLPTGQEVTIDIPKCSNHEQQITLFGKGLNGGKYIYILKIQMPNKISDEVEKLLQQIEKEEA